MNIHANKVSIWCPGTIVVLNITCNHKFSNARASDMTTKRVCVLCSKYVNCYWKSACVHVMHGNNDKSPTSKSYGITHFIYNTFTRIDS